MSTSTDNNEVISSILKGEGEIQLIKRTRVRIGCDECGEYAQFRHGFLLNGARNNPASSAYRKDDCSWCSDKNVFTCVACKRPQIDGYEWCNTFEAGDRFAHMFLQWLEEKQ